MRVMNAANTVVSTPAHAPYARIVRMVANATAAETLPVDQLDDLGLAIDEVYSLLLKSPLVDAMEFEFVAGEHEIAVVGRALGGAGHHWPPEDWDESLEAVVLTAVARAVELTNGNHPEIHFTVGGPTS